MREIIFWAKTKSDKQDTASTVHVVKVPEGFSPTTFARSYYHSANNLKDIPLPSGIEKLANWGAHWYDRTNNRKYKITL